MVTYNPTKDKVYALLKDQAKSDDIIKAAFHVSISHCDVIGIYVLVSLYVFLLRRLMCYCILLMHHMHGG